MKDINIMGVLNVGLVKVKQHSVLKVDVAKLNNMAFLSTFGNCIFLPRPDMHRSYAHCNASTTVIV